MQTQVIPVSDRKRVEVVRGMESAIDENAKVIQPQYKTISVGLEDVTPAMAQEFLTWNFEHNRPLQASHVQFLAKQMKDGKFCDTGEIHITYENGRPQMVNGQHQCSAIVAVGKTVRLTVRRTISTSNDVVAQIYAYGHDTQKKRTMGDALSGYGLSEKTGLGPRRASDLATALRHIRLVFVSEGKMGGNSIRYVSPEELVVKCIDWAPYASMYWNGIVAQPGSDNGFRSTIDKRGALSVVLVTFRYQPDAAYEFWEKVVNHSGILTTDPRAVARRVLENSKQRGNGVAAKPPGVLSRELARCWRGFIDGESMTQVPKLIREADPIVIKGTPYDGKQPPAPWWPS